MNQIISKNQDFPKDSPYAHMPLFDLITEMEQMGIPTAPYLELAAKDLLDKFGTDAFSYSATIYEKMKQDKNAEGIYLWNRFHEILERFFVTSSQCVQ